jgi:hypothetical protein
MASGDTLFVLEPESSRPPTANFATLDTIPDTSTPPMDIPVLDFDGGANEHADWYVTIPNHYAGDTGFTFSYKYAMDGTDGDIVELEFRVLSIPDQTVLTGDLGMDGQTPVAITDDPDATADDLNYSTTGTLAKALFSSVGADARICIRATRDITIAANANDLQLLEILVKET